MEWYELATLPSGKMYPVLIDEVPMQMEQMGQKKKTTFFRLHCLGLGTDLKQRQRLEGDLISISDL